MEENARAQQGLIAPCGTVGSYPGQTLLGYEVNLFLEKEVSKAAGKPGQATAGFPVYFPDMHLL